MKRWKIIVLAGAVMLALGGDPRAQATVVGIDNLSVQASLQVDGTVAVSEQLSLVGPSPLDWVVLSRLKSLVVTADGKIVPGSEIKTNRSSSSEQISSKTISAKTWQIDYITTSNLVRHDNRDQFFFKIFETPGVSVGQIEATFSLPQGVDRSMLTGNVYAIGGVVGADQTVTNDREIDYKADFAGPNGLMTINASWPNTLLKLSPWQEAKLTLSTLDALPWIVLGVALPLATLLVLAVLSWRQRRIDRIKIVGRIDQPPSALSPLIVGVLVNKKIYPEEIVALLIDLCLRGYLVIVKKGDDFFLGKRRLPDQFLQPWEAEILNTLLTGGDLTVSDKDLLAVNKQSLFSPEVRMAFEQVYQVITQSQYFTENPHLTRIRYKLIGLFFYFTSVVGLIWIAVTDATPYLIIPLGGTILLSWLILRLTNKLIHYSDTGNKERANWLAFANFLSDRSPLDPHLLRDQTFERFLPYAIVLHQTQAWASRFDQASTVRVRPDWFINYEEMTTATFVREITAFTGKVSKIIAGLRGPLVN